MENYEKTMLDRLPPLKNLVNKELEGQEISPIAKEHMNTLEGKNYYDCVLSFDQNIINAIQFFGGKHGYCPIYTNIYLREKKFDDFDGFNGLIKILAGKNITDKSPKDIPLGSKLEVGSKSFKRKLKLSSEMFCKTPRGTSDLQNKFDKILEQNKIKEFFESYMEEEHEEKIFPANFKVFDNNEFYIACGFSNDIEKIFWSYVDESMFKKSGNSSKKIKRTANKLSFQNDKNIFDAYESTEKSTIKPLANICLEKGTLFFRRFLDLTYLNNVVLAGDCILNLLLQTYTSVYDIFIHSCSSKKAKELINNFIKKGGKFVKNAKYSTDAVSVFLLNCQSCIEVKFHLKIYKSPNHIAMNFDLDSSCILYDFLSNNFYATERFVYSIVNEFNTVNFEKLSSSYERRLTTRLNENLGIHIPLYSDLISLLDTQNMNNSGGLSEIILRTLAMKNEIPLEENEELEEYTEYTDISFEKIKSLEQSNSSVISWCKNEKLPENDETLFKLVTKTVEIDITEDNLALLRTFENWKIYGEQARSLFLGKKCKGLLYLSSAIDFTNKCSFSYELLSKKLSQYQDITLQKYIGTFLESYIPVLKIKYHFNKDFNPDNLSKVLNSLTNIPHDNDIVREIFDQFETKITTAKIRRPIDLEHGNEQEEQDNDDQDNDNEEDEDNDEEDEEEYLTIKNMDMNTQCDKYSELGSLNEYLSVCANPFLYRDNFCILFSNDNIISSLVNSIFMKNLESIYAFLKPTDLLTEILLINQKLCEISKMISNHTSLRSVYLREYSSLYEMSNFFGIKDYNRISAKILSTSTEKAVVEFEYYSNDKRKIKKSIHNSRREKVNIAILKELQTKSLSLENPEKILELI